MTSSPKREKLEVAAPEKEFRLTYSNVTLTNSDVRRLDKQELLNDSVIDFFIKMILNILPCDKKTFGFSSLFYTRLKGDAENQNTAGCLQSAVRWSKGVSLFEQDILVVPINDNNVHWWVALMVNPGAALKNGDSCTKEGDDAPRLIYLDSLAGVAQVQDGKYRRIGSNQLEVKNHVSHNFKRYMEEECKSLDNQVFDSMAMEDLSARVPLQQNFTDCGVFVLEYVAQVLQRPSILAHLGKVKCNDWFSQDVVDHRRLQLKALIEYFAKKTEETSQTLEGLLAIDEHRAKAIEFLTSKPEPKKRACQAPDESGDTAVTVGLGEIADSEHMKFLVKLTGTQDQQDFDAPIGWTVVVTELRNNNGKWFLRCVGKFDVPFGHTGKLQQILNARVEDNHVVMIARHDPSGKSSTAEENDVLSCLGLGDVSLGPRALFVGSKTAGAGVTKNGKLSTRVLMLRAKYGESGLSVIDPKKKKDSISGPGCDAESKKSVPEQSPDESCDQQSEVERSEVPVSSPNSPSPRETPIESDFKEPATPKEALVGPPKSPAASEDSTQGIKRDAPESARKTTEQPAKIARTDSES